MIYELIYPSGHRQIIGEIATGIEKVSFYYSHTFSADGDLLEFRILSGRQLERTIERVRRFGGEVREKSAPSHEPYRE